MNSLGRLFFSVTAVCLLYFSDASLLFAKDEADARAHFLKGTQSLIEENPYQAVEAFRAALHLNPAYADARLGMAEALFRLGEYEEAAGEIESARPYVANSRNLKLLEGRVLTALTRYDEAIAIYRELLVFRPHDSEAHRGLAEIYTITGQWELADEVFARSLQYSPGDRRVLLQLAALYDETRQKKLADAAILEALRLFPNNFNVRLQAAEHFALYDEWDIAMEHLYWANSMLNGDDDRRFPRTALLEAELSLLHGDPANALKVLRKLPALDSSSVLYLLARAHRDLGQEEEAQDLLSRLLHKNPDDEISRMLREEFLMNTSKGFTAYRKEAAAWHLERGRLYEESFHYQRAYDEYRRAKLLFKDDPDVWMAYTRVLRKMGFREHYKDSLGIALMDIPSDRPENAILKERLELLDHSEKASLAEKWGVRNPWTLDPTTWDMGVYIIRGGSSLPIHPASDDVLALYLADLLDSQSNIAVTMDETGYNLELRFASDFSEAFRESRGLRDYFILVQFAETDRTFSATAELYLSRTGELLGRFDELRTGQNRVSDALHMLSDTLGARIPDRMAIAAIDGNRVLLNKGRWHSIDGESPWIVIRKDVARPAAVEGGLFYTPEDYLGIIDIVEVSEPISEGVYTRAGDFDFVSLGDELFLLPVPEDIPQSTLSADPAFRARLLSIP